MNMTISRGRLTTDPEVRYTQDGDSVVSFVLAIPDRSRPKDKDGNFPADFVKMAVFGKQAEVAEAYCCKGTELLVKGRIKSGSYQNKDGATVYTTEVHVDNFEFLSGTKKDKEKEADAKKK